MVVRTQGQAAVWVAALAMAAPAMCGTAHASNYYNAGYADSSARVLYQGVNRFGGYRIGGSHGALQCVPFARENTGIELSGNAVNWWANAAGVYERGSRPEVGSVLNFRATGRMYMGHVAVVSNVIDARNVQIDHANWSGRGVITRNVTVIDVSPANDWSAVRVALGNGDFGSVYPTYGFIYDRPDKGMMVANAGVRGSGAASATAVLAPAPVITLAAAAPLPGRATIDLRPSNARTAVLLSPPGEVEVAEAAEAGGTRGYGRGVPTIHYGRAPGPVVRYGQGGLGFAGYGSSSRLTAGRMMGGQVLFVGRAPAREAAYGTGGHGYGGLVRVATTHGEHGLAHAVPVRGAQRRADAGSHRLGRRACGPLRLVERLDPRLDESQALASLAIRAHTPGGLLRPASDDRRAVWRHGSEGGRARFVVSWHDALRSCPPDVSLSPRGGRIGQQSWAFTRRAGRRWR